jgi:hypothetical protein
MGGGGEREEKPLIRGGRRKCGSYSQRNLLVLSIIIRFKTTKAFLVYNYDERGSRKRQKGALLAERKTRKAELSG